MSRDQGPTWPSKGPTVERATHVLVLGATAFTIRELPARGDLEVGRSPDAGISILERSVSRRHAVFRVRDAVTLVEDLGSANGTWANGVRVAAEGAPVGPGSVVRVGDVLLLVRGGALPGPGNAIDRELARKVAAAPPVVLAPATKALHALLDQVAPTAMNLLILGETGTGKEVIAREAHARSPRASKEFLSLNCAALAETLVESELFGHEKGAFTGADQARAGLLESAPGGTVFLDEVGELPLPVQAKLLRVLEDRTVVRLGSAKPRPIDVRWVAATNRDLQVEARAGRFREDLFFRLNGFTLRVPPLRDRVEEIEPLARRFAESFATELGRPTPELSEEAVRHLRTHAWPGNVRELRNIIQAGVILAGSGPLRAEHLPLGAPAAAPPETAPPPKKRPRGTLDKDEILAALDACGGNRTKAAERLGISRRWLLAKLEQLGLGSRSLPREAGEGRGGGPPPDLPPLRGGRSDAT